MCISVAGPVNPDNTCQMTNLDWVVDGDALAARFQLLGARVTLLPDGICGFFDIGALQQQPDNALLLLQVASSW